jgi:hypothetical protein
MSTGGSSTSGWTLRTPFGEVEDWIEGLRASDTVKRGRPAQRRIAEQALAAADS